MNEKKLSYKEILAEESEILSKVISAQSDLRCAVNNKDWPQLMKVISEINLSMDSFNRLDEEREEAAVNAGSDDMEAQALLSEVRGKLVRCRTENKALGDYINITRNFVQGVIDTAVPGNRAKVYGKNGFVKKEQPSSVVVNTLF